MKRLIPLFLVFVACSDTLDGVGNVHDLRLLGMRAEPPEQFITYDGGITVTALLANPPGGFLVGGKWSTCSELDSTTGRCLESSPGFKVLAPDTTSKTGPDGAEASITFSPDPVLLQQIAKADPYRGLAGIRQIVQVELRAGDESVVGIKRVVFQIPSKMPMKLNVNPVVGPIEFNDAGWGPNDTVQLEVAAPRTPGQMFTPAAVRNQLAVIEDKTLQEDYDVRTFEAQTRTLRETWRYNFFASNGAFSPTTGGGNNIVTPDAGVETRWARVDGEDAGRGPTTVWIVVRDGRGGENWAVRHAEAP